MEDIESTHSMQELTLCNLFHFKRDKCPTSLNTPVLIIFVKHFFPNL